MEAWVGPAIIAAVVSGFVSAAGWFVNSWQAMDTERRRRREKVHDFQAALRAEIASDLLSMVVFDRPELLRQVAEKYRSDPKYSVLVPHLASNVIFDAIVGEIHILPAEVIAPVVGYARLRQILERFAIDLRATSFAQLASERQLSMYSDYLDTMGRLEGLAQEAVTALDKSLVSSRDADRSIRPLAGAQGAGPEQAPDAEQGQGEP